MNVIICLIYDCRYADNNVITNITQFGTDGFPFTMQAIYTSKLDAFNVWTTSPNIEIL